MTVNGAELFDEHLPYEIDMLFATHHLLSVGVEDPVVRNALIESFCIHARALINFFEGKGGASALSFANDNYVPFLKGRVRESLKRMLSQQIAHLTYERTSLENKKIGPEEREELITGIQAELRHFQMHLKAPFNIRWRTR